MNSLKFPKITNTDNITNYNIKNLNNTLIESTDDKEERAALIEAIKIGYLLYPSKDLIWDKFKKQVDYDENKCKKLVRKTKNSKLIITETLENDYSKIYFLNMSKIPLFEIGDLFICRNLLILNLSNNFLMNIEPLFDCIHLIRLDLQNNQLSKLPSGEFWSRFKKLKVLFLHNNLIGRLEYLKYMSYCPVLEILTMYDSPISLKYNYRHHTVNSIVTLKALDHHVISDEEIIEEASFKNTIFTAGCDNFKVDLSINCEENSLSAELKATMKLINQVNKILAKFSPVLIIQRYARGFLVRRKLFKIKMKEKIEAIIKIQQWWKRVRKNLKKNKPQQRAKSINKENSDLQNLIATESFLTDYKLRKKDSRRNNTPISAYRSKRNFFVDFNKINYSRQSTMTNLNLEKNLKFPSLNFNRSTQSIQKSDQLSFREELITRIFKDTSLDSEKLIKISQMISNVNESLDLSQIPRDLNFEYITFIINQINTKLKRPKEELSVNNDSFNSEPEHDSSEFRLPIIKPNNDIIKSKDKYIIDLIKDKVKDINAIKTLDLDGHKQISFIKRVDKVEPQEFLTNDQRFFQKIYGNMTIGSLRAVDKAYEERNLNDMKLTLHKQCSDTREYEKNSQRQLRLYKEEIKREIRENSQKSKLDVVEAKKKMKKDLEETRKIVKEKRERMIQFKKNRRRDIALAVEFSKQHISVSKALQKHEFTMRKETILKEKSNFVLDFKTDIESQNELVRKFIQQRTNIRQMQAITDKQIIENRIKIDKEIQVNRAKDRVELLKSLQPVKYQHLETYKFDFIPPDENLNALDSIEEYNTLNDISLINKLANNQQNFKLIKTSVLN